MKVDQVGALCVRRRGDGSCQVLLVTSKDSGRWIIPKGWRAKRLEDFEAAEREANEEAGVSGKLKTKPIGTYSYPKIDDSGSRLLRVSVFLLQVKKEKERWPERRQRKRAWFDVRDAIKKVWEPALQKLILRLDHS